MPTNRLFSRTLAITVIAALATPARAAAPDPLARAELDLDITLNMRGTSVGHVYDALASITHVPFILAFDEDDPSLKVTFQAKNMGVRAILGSLARTYGLEYATADAAILVTRKGQPPTEKRKTVGPWQPPVERYRLTLVIRSRDGRELSKPSVTTGLHQEATMKQGVQGIPGSDSGSSFMEVQLTPQKETADGLELDVKWAVHEGTTRTAAGTGETILFTTPQGFQVGLEGWSRQSSDSAGQP
jgi:hypothetical protein